MRNGKIATLPSDIRDLLSWRMEQGENSGDLLAWLNGHPKVQDSIKNSFDSAPINKQNLSQWRRGGFREWQFHHQFMRAAIHIEDDFEQLTDGVDVPLLAGKMAAFSPPATPPSSTPGMARPALKLVRRLRIADCPQDEPPGQAGSKPVKPSQSEKTAPAVNAGTAPSSQAGSNPVKPSQSETSGLTVNPESAAGELKTAA